MTGRNDRGVSPGRGIAGVLAAAVLLTLGAQGAMGSPSDKKERDGKKAAEAQPAAKAPAPAPATQKADSVTRSVGGAQVTIDPATGRLQQPTPEQAQTLATSLQHLLSREVQGLATTELPGGGVMVDLEDTFQEVVMASVDRKGRLRLQCVNDEKQAMAILNGAAARQDVAVYGNARAADKKAAGKTSRAAAEKE